jgi:hypothetical protein
MLGNQENFMTMAAFELDPLKKIGILESVVAIFQGQEYR